MLRLIEILSSLRNDRRGVTALEYGLIAGLVAVVIAASVTTLGQNLNSVFSKIASSI